jgi:hypothetical protein
MNELSSRIRFMLQPVLRVRITASRSERLAESLDKGFLRGVKHEVRINCYSHPCWKHGETIFLQEM